MRRTQARPIKHIATNQRQSRTDTYAICLRATPDHADDRYHIWNHRCVVYHRSAREHPQ